jgi:DNA mismatch repair protein MutS
MDIYKLTIPEIVNDKSLLIEGGRHLVSEHINPGFVENDFEGSHPVTIVTGPNYSGKSVFLKQIALIVYLCHIGLPVPAKYAKIGLFDVMVSLFAGETLRTCELK